MIIFKGIISGIIATLFFDIFQYAISYSYSAKRSNWALIGRYFIIIKKLKVIKVDIKEEPEEKNELIFGYLIHYLIGIIFGITYVILNYIIYDSSPSILLAISIGIVTVIFGWCFIHPNVMNMGYFASKMDNQKQILTQNLLVHYIFGTGLFIGFLIVS